MKKLLYLAIATLICGCSHYKPTAKHKCIAPLPACISVDNLQDCTTPAAFTPDSFNWEGENLTMTVYNMDLYDAIEISQMQIGDTIIYDGSPIIINKISEKNGGIDINGSLDEGGCCLSGHEGGTYVANHWDGHATYTRLGKAEVALSENFVIIDCGMNPDDPNDTIRTDQKLYIEKMKDSRPDFFQLNTCVTIENGMITKINRRWIP